MLLLLKNSADTTEGKRGLKLATNLEADLVLLQNGIYLAQNESLRNFNRSIYLLDEDMRLRGINPESVGIKAKVIDYDGLINLMIDHEKVIGLF
jgi:sulfur relay protein TusB/DsrH